MRLPAELQAFHSQPVPSNLAEAAAEARAAADGIVAAAAAASAARAEAQHALLVASASTGAQGSPWIVGGIMGAGVQTPRDLAAASLPQQQTQQQGMGTGSGVGTGGAGVAFGGGAQPGDATGSVAPFQDVFMKWQGEGWDDEGMDWAVQGVQGL
jgi:hypothetical protein